MKRFIIGLLAALVLTLALAGIAAAAQVKTTVGNQTFYKTTPQRVYDNSTGWNNVFNADDVSNYPNEIYLPNESNPAGYRIHTNYAKNTDACASCHATHTAAGKSLLQWYSVYDTCMACHDGTVTSTYNVVLGKIGASDKPAYGGVFGTGPEEFASNHNAKGALTISAAPGGSTNLTAEAGTVGNSTVYSWAPAFGCESCHSPHGQGANARILNPDPNYAQSTKRAASYTNYTLSRVDDGDVYYVAYANNATKQDPMLLIQGYPYSSNQKFYVDNGEKVLNTDLTLSNADGYTKITFTTDPGAGAAVTATFTPSLKVTMQINNYLGNGGDENVIHKTGLNNFCGACHTDYNTSDEKNAGKNPAQEVNGKYSEAYRHAVGYKYSGAGGVKNMKFEWTSGDEGTGSAYVTCLTCHVAHGVNKGYWTLTLNDTTSAAFFQNESYAVAELAEVAGSSALKRKPNMGTCESCHAKEEGNEGYADSTGLPPVQPAATTVDVPVTEAFIGEYTDNFVGSAACASCHKDYLAGWKETLHAKPIGTCGENEYAYSCHLNGAKVMGRTPNITGTPLETAFDLNTGSAGWDSGDVTEYGVDAGITCESCHSSGKRHILNPSSKNIIKPVTFYSKVLSCAKCHNNYDEYLKGWPTINADTTSSQLGFSNTHGGPYSYDNSAHYQQKIVDCTTCHDPHGKNSEGKQLRLTYAKLCSSCHDAVDTLANTMGPKYGHPIAGGTYDHSFKFSYAAGTTGVPTTISSVTTTIVSGINSKASINAGTPLVLKLVPVVRDNQGIQLTGDATKVYISSVTNSNASGGGNFYSEPNQAAGTVTVSSVRTTTPGRVNISVKSAFKPSAAASTFLTINP